MKLPVCLLALCGLSFGHLFADELPWDGRSERAAFVTTLIKPGDVGIEIGVQMGIFAYHVLLPCQPAKLYLVDPWSHGIQGYETTPEFGREYEYETVCRVFKPHSNVEIVRMTSDDAVDLFPNDSFDYVYIDGEHSYAAVKRDLANYFPKVKVGGYVIGDDYGWSGIADAVQEFVRSHKDELTFLDDPYSGRTGGQFAIRRLK